MNQRKRRFNPILDRNEVSACSVEIAGEREPLVTTITFPYDKVNVQTLVKFLFLLHQKSGLEPAMKFPAYLRSAKKLLDEFGEKRLIGAMVKASAKSKHSWSFKYVERFLGGEYARGD